MVQNLIARFIFQQFVIKMEVSMKEKNKLWGLFLLSLAIILAGSLLAWSVDTSGGKVDVKLVDFIGEDGRLIHGRIYIPNGVTSDNPAPGVVFCPRRRCVK